MNIEEKNLIDLQGEVDEDINHQQNEQVQISQPNSKTEEQIAQQNNNLQNPIDDQNHAIEQNQQEQELDLVKEALYQKFQKLHFGQQMRCVFEHYNIIIITQFYFIIELFLNLLCYYQIINKSQNNLQYVFCVWILLDIIQILYNIYYYFHTLKHIQKANKDKFFFKYFEQFPDKGEDMIQLMIDNSRSLEILLSLIKLLQNISVLIISIILLINIQELLTLGSTFIYLIMTLNFSREINPFFNKFNFLYYSKIQKIKPLYQQMTKRRITYLNNKTAQGVLFPLLYLYEIKTMLDVYHKLPTECSYLDSYFYFAFFIDCCIILELIINALMTYNKLNEEIDFFEKNLLGVIEIIFLFGILISWFFIYLNYDQECFLKKQEYSQIRACLLLYPANKIISYTYCHYKVFSMNLLSRSEQGKVLKNLAEENMCIICLQEFQLGEEFVRLKCHQDHVYHKNCILDWLEKSQTCPKCKDQYI